MKLTRHELELYAYVAVANFFSSETFPYLSPLEHGAFEHWFVEGFLDAVQRLTPKLDWTGELERKPDANFNQDSYNAGYGKGLQETSLRRRGNPRMKARP